MVLSTGNHLMVAHHEGLRPHPEEIAKRCVSKDRAKSQQTKLFGGPETARVTIAGSVGPHSGRFYTYPIEMRCSRA